MKMVSSVTPEIIERLGSFLRLRSRFSGEDIDSWMRVLASPPTGTPEGRVGDARNRPFVLAD
jgi:hypothetical protein